MVAPGADMLEVDAIGNGNFGSPRPMSMSVMEQLPPAGYYISQSRRNSGINERELVLNIEVLTAKTDLPD